MGRFDGANMAAKDTFSENESWWDRVTRDLALDVAATLAVLYAVGLLIVNVDLGRHGVVAVDLARPEYIMVGLLWAILQLFTIAVILFVIWLVRHNAT